MANDAEKEFVSMAAHQLQGPLTVMNWTLDSILAGRFGRLTPQLQQGVRKVYETNKEITRLVVDLLTVARLEGARLQLKIVPTDLAVLVRKIMDRYDQDIKEHHGEMYFTGPRDGLLDVPVDPILMSQVIDNLISNAIKYNPVKTHITITITREHSRIVVAVRNRGPAIPVDKQASLFQKFSRAQAPGTQKTSGTGLGLYITKQIVELHGGEISFESVPGKDTTFFITLPLLAAVG